MRSESDEPLQDIEAIESVFEESLASSSSAQQKINSQRADHSGNDPQNPGRQQQSRLKQNQAGGSQKDWQKEILLKVTGGIERDDDEGAKPETFEDEGLQEE